jgi:polysaccharide biosynthesis protein PelE
MTGRPMHHVRFLGVWILSGVADFPFFMAFVYDPTWVINYHYEAVGLHIIASCILFFSTPRDQGFWHPQRLWARPGVMLVGVFSIFGWVALGIMYLLYCVRPYTTTTTVEEEMDFVAKPVNTTLLLEQGDKRQRILRELDIIPLGDIMAGDNTELKRGAIDALAQLKTREAVELLEAYRSDPSPDIRFFVTTGLTQVRIKYEEELHAARETLAKDSKDLASRIALARTYLLYSHSGLLDETTAQSYVGEALYHLQFSIMAEDAPLDVFWLLTDIYTAQKQWDKVIQVLEVLEGRNLAPLRQYLAIKANALHGLGHYPQLVTLLTKAQASDEVPPPLVALANWWGSGGTAA